MNTANRLHAALGGTPDIGVDMLTHAGTAYVLTTGTGDGDFAYTEADVSAWLDALPDSADHYEDGAPNPYQGFCDAVAPVDDDRPLARAALDEGYRICVGGLCRPIIDAEAAYAEREPSDISALYENSSWGETLFSSPNKAIIAALAGYLLADGLNTVAEALAFHAEGFEKTWAEFAEGFNPDRESADAIETMREDAERLWDDVAAELRASDDSDEEE